MKHPGYTDASGSFDNDVMVIKLYGWSSKHQVVRLNQDQNIPIDNEDLHVAGWGVVNTATEQTADKLKDVSVYYMTNEECKSKTGRIEGYTQLFTLKNKITDNMMCALDVGEDACQGGEYFGVRNFRMQLSLDPSSYLNGVLISVLFSRFWRAISSKEELCSS